MSYHSFGSKVTAWVILLVLCTLWLAPTPISAQTTATSTVWSLAWHPNSTVLAIGINLDGTVTGVQLVDFAANTSTWLGTPGNVVALSWSPDGTMLAGCIITSPGYLYLIWDTTTKKQLLVVEQETELDGWSIGWSPDSTKVALPSSYSVSIWDAKDLKQLARLSEFTSNAQSIDAVAWHSDGAHLLVAQSQIIRIWDLSSQRVVRDYNLDVTIYALTLSPTGDRFAIGTTRGRVLIFSTDTGELLDTLQAQNTEQAISFLDWNSLDDQIAGANYSGPITIWSPQDGQVVDSFETDVYSLRDIEFSPGGGRLAYGKVNRDQVSELETESQQSFFDDAAQIVIPALSWDRLNMIQMACIQSSQGAETVVIPQNEAGLEAYIAQVESAPDAQLSSACAADLVAVAEALQSQ